MTNKIIQNSLIIECGSGCSANPDSKGPDRLEITEEDGSLNLQITNDLETSNTVILDSNGIKFLANYLQARVTE